MSIMDKILKRDILSGMTDVDVMKKHKIKEYRTLRQLWFLAKGFNIEVDKKWLQAGA